MSLVSILIPCYNAERWIAGCIESALAQTWKTTEVIVVDDGSTDDSLAIIRTFDGRVKCYTGPRRGGNAARNELLRRAKGNWLQFLDADDYLRPEKISRQLSSMESSGIEADVIYSPVTTEVWGGDVLQEHSVAEINSSRSLFEQWVRWQVAQTGSVLWRRDALTGIGGWNEEFTCCQDNEVTLRAIQHGLRFHLCQHADAVYRIWTEDSVSRRDPSRLVRTRTMLNEQMLAWLENRGELTASIADAAAQMFFEMARTLAIYDLEQAAAYKQERVRAGYFRPSGPAAPLCYRVLHRMLGFSNTERIARWQRDR